MTSNSKETVIVREVPSKVVVEILDLLEGHGVEIYVDGGWGIDALVGTQTRKHDDLDIATPHEFVPIIREILGNCGYSEVLRDDSRDCNFVLGDPAGHEIDVHSYTFDKHGNNIFGIAYEPRHLTGKGVIAGRSVNCIPADVMMVFHTGYPVDENDYHDVRVLADKFGLPIPRDYEKFEQSEK